MKKLHIVALILVAIAIAAIIIFSSSYTTYEGFEKANENPEMEYKIVGILDKEQAMDYTPEINPNLFSFYMIDKNNVTQQVVYKDAKPQDFERSEQLVVTGKSKDGVFYADQMLMKCPSKYVENEMDMVEVKAGEE